MKRSHRVGAICQILTESPERVFNLKYFCDRFSAAKSSISEDISAAKEAVEATGYGYIETIPGAAGGVKYVPDISPERAAEVQQHLCDLLREDGRIGSFACVLEKNVFVTYGDRQGIARAKGVDRSYEESTPLASHVTAGTFSLHRGELAQVSVGAGMAYDMGINPRFLEHLVLHYPKEGTVNPLLGPSSALGSESLVVGSLFSVSSETDAGLIVVPIEVMRRLVGRGAGGVVSGVELRVAGGVAAARLRDEVSASLGPGFNVEDRYMQNSSLYKMMRYEKLAIFTILLFVVIIVAFNIFGSLSMLVVEKEDDIEMLRAMGARPSFVRRVFRLEGWMVSLCGLVCGLVCGVGLALLQQHFGFIKMPGGFFIQAYPVRLQLSDVVLTAAGVALIGFVIAFLSSSRSGGSSQ